MTELASPALASCSASAAIDDAAELIRKAKAPLC